MKIHAVSTSGSKIIKFMSLWPLIGLAFSLSLWVNKSSIFFLIPIVLFLFLFIYTLFFACYELYIDSENQKVIKKIKWLFINSKLEFPLSDYKGIYISLGGSVAKNNYGSLKSIQLYDVVLVHKYSATDTAYGTNIMENFVLSYFIKSPEEAKEIALEFSKQLNIEVFVEKQVAKTHPNLLKYAEGF